MVPRELILQCYLQSRSPVFLKTTSRDRLLNSYPFMEPLLGRALGCALREAQDEEGCLVLHRAGPGRRGHPPSRQRRLCL